VPYELVIKTSNDGGMMMRRFNAGYSVYRYISVTIDVPSWLASRSLRTIGGLAEPRRTYRSEPTIKIFSISRCVGAAVVLRMHVVFVSRTPD